MESARRHYRSLGFEVQDTSSTQPYDYLCTRPGRVLHVEVKGTTGSADSVLITEGERRHALEAFPDVALYVLHSIELAGRHGNRPVASGGIVRRLDPWDIQDCRIETVTARCYLPTQTRSEQLRLPLTIT